MNNQTTPKKKTKKRENKKIKEQVDKKMSDAELKKEDAKNFYCQLLTKINSCYDKNNYINCETTKNYNKEEDKGKCKNKKINKRNYRGDKCKRKTNSDDTEGCLLEETEEEICDGKKIRMYLEHVVPEWKKMTPSRLYNHVQKMHENSEGVRRFEIDLIWRRAIYFIPLIVIFFTAFGGAFFSFQSEFGIIDANKFVDANITINQNSETTSKEIKGYIISDYSDEETKKENKPIYENKSKKGHWILLGIAFINACLCFFLTKMSIESHRWQSNWERHIDYLQQILGFKLMQTCLRPRGIYFSIQKTNTFIGFFAFLVWYFAMVLLFYLILEIEFDFQFKHYKSLYDSFLFSLSNHFLVIILILILFSFLTISLILILAAPRAVYRLTLKAVCETIHKIISSFTLKAVYKIIDRVVWQIIAISVVSILAMNLILEYQALAPILVPILVLVAISIFINDIYYCLTGKSIFKESKKIRVSKDNRFYMRELEIFREGDEDLKIYEDKKGINSIIITSSSVIIFYIPFIILIASYIINNVFNIKLTFDLIIILATFIPCTSIFFSRLIEGCSEKNSETEN